MISPGFVISVLATATAALATLWLLYEDWAVWHSDKSGRPTTPASAVRKDLTADRIYVLAKVRRLAAGDNTITAWTRYYERLLDQHHKSHWLTIAVLILGLVLGHLLWH